MFTLPNRNVLRKRVCGNVLRIFFDAINQNVMRQALSLLRKLPEFLFFRSIGLGRFDNLHFISMVLRMEPLEHYP